MKKTHFGLIGSGATAVYLIRHFHQHLDRVGKQLGKISIFERTTRLGMGMPYNPAMTDRYNLSNISSEELPCLDMTFAEWLRQQGDEVLEQWDIRREDISEDAVYCRLALGEYLQDRFHHFVSKLRQGGIEVDIHCGCRVDDLVDRSETDTVWIRTATVGEVEVDRAIIATGHSWQEKDRPEQGYYASPWPIRKLMPEDGKYHNFEVGTLGASLSAFDVVSSLAHRHGRFVQAEEGLRYEPHPGSEGFKLTLHAAHGWLPQLQFEQVEPLRKIYRQCHREQLLSMRDSSGFLRIDTYFDEICRPSLVEAFRFDGRSDLASTLAESSFGLRDLVATLESERECSDPFEKMRQDLEEASTKIESDRPHHWKEVIDDLVYCLNFHAELLPAEDHLTLTSVLMPFQMNVIAALPLPSARILLALREAGILNLMAGHVEIERSGEASATTRMLVRKGEETFSIEYPLFVDCSGQKPTSPEHFPCPSLARSGAIRPARTRFAEANGPGKFREKGLSHRLAERDGEIVYLTGGIDIDAAYHLINREGIPNPRLFDVSFAHGMGVRPYSYGLQACDATAAILVEAWLESAESNVIVSDVVQVSHAYATV